MISTIGFMPSIAAPTAEPSIALSEIGVSNTRAGPKSRCRPRDTPKIPPAFPTSSP